MAELKIFIAGSKELKAERNGIKIIANDLSSLYGSKGIHLTAHSYEHFDEDQDSYNRFITQEADIVIFILDGYIGSKTEEEFVAATNSFHDNKRPEIMIFMREYDGKSLTPDIARVQGLIMGSLGSGKYHVDYSSLDDLKAKAKERIMRYINKCEAELENNSGKTAHVNGVGCKDSLADGGTAGKATLMRRILYGSSLLVMLVLLVFFGWNYFAGNTQQGVKDGQAMLVFSGGGSVADYIRNMTDGAVDVKRYDGSIYINLPSGSAWTLLLEEAVRWNEERMQPFASVVLSADRIDSVQIDYKVQNIRSQACITGYFLGHDTLAVFVEKDFAVSYGLLGGDGKENLISAKEFADLIKYVKDNKDNVRLYTTNKSSGTLRKFQRVVDCIRDDVNFDDMLDKEESHPFYQDSSSDYLYMLNGEVRRPFIMLGSENYYARKAGNYCKFNIYSDDKVVAKEMYIYFMAYRNLADDEYYFSPGVLELLKELGAHETLPADVWKMLSECRLPDRRGHMIFYLNK